MKLTRINFCIVHNFFLQFGFSLGRTLIDAINPYVHNHLDGCLLQNVSNLKAEQKDDSSIIYFTMDLKNLTYVFEARDRGANRQTGRRFAIRLRCCRMQVNCSSNIHAAHIYRNPSAVSMYRTKRSSLSARFSDTALFPRRKRNTSHGESRIGSRTTKLFLPPRGGETYARWHVSAGINIVNKCRDEYVRCLIDFTRQFNGISHA